MSPDYNYHHPCHDGLFLGSYYHQSPDKNVDKVECENEKKQEPSSANKQNNRMHAVETISREPLASSNGEKSATKGEDKNADKLECDNEKKQEPYLENKQDANHMHATETVARKPLASSSAKKSCTKGEVANSTNSALTKLTARLNFMRERQSQIAKEMLGSVKGQGSIQSVLSPGKAEGPQPLQEVQNEEKAIAPDICK
ncbi:hypothetical protein GOBAR_AA32514 [Gossypium barbadense]|uniref:Uncharacterized protein n=1 Tax=Gossypium barbadense TaxID=3634 RepID=A0A2P5WAR0_GOSBA|nr:hypothetical protein GOBAR_AA32514 [Gossypium barbadense]